MKQISPAELREMLDAKAQLQIIDVREPYEVEICSIGGTNIPLGEVIEHLDKIRKDIPVVVHCRSGKRSMAMIQALTDRHGFSNLVNLEGGIMSWISEVDPSLDTY